MIGEGAGEYSDQFSEEVEAALPCLYALLPQKLMQGSHYGRDLYL